MNYYKTSGLMALAVALLANPANAQDGQAPSSNLGAGEQTSAPEDVSLQEIVVTAQRRAERLQDVPLSISAISGAALEASGVTRLSDIRGATPNLYLQDTGGVYNNPPIIRGITSSGDGIAFDPALAVYVDGVLLSRPAVFNQELVDIDRLEVLRGPQGTLYGRGAVGGAINVITKKPANDFTAKANAEYGNYDAWRLNGAVSGPVISDKLFFGLSGNVSERDGYFSDVLRGGDIGGLKSRSVRGRLRALVAESTEINLTADWSLDRTTAGYLVQPIGDGTVAGAIGVPLAALGYVPRDPLDREIAYDADSSERLSQWGVAGTIDHDFGEGFALTSITSYREYGSLRRQDTDRTEVPLLAALLDEKTWQFSQEIRIVTPQDKPLRFTGGLYYFAQNARERISLDYLPFFADLVGAFIPPELGGPFAPGTFTGQNQTSRSTVKTRSYAAFGELTYAFNSKFDITGGLRVTREEKTLDLGQTVAGTPVPIAPLFGTDNFGPIVQNYGETDFSPSFTLRFRPVPELNTYIRVARGFRPGGFNSRLPTVVNGVAEQLSFNAENVWNYEAGIKLRGLNNRLTLDLAIFRMDQRNKQVPIFDGTRETVRNAGGVRSEGFEVELGLRPTSDLRFSVGAGYTSAIYRNFRYSFIDQGTVPPTTVVVDNSGLRQEGTPQWTVNSAVDFDRPLSDNLRLNAHLDVNLVDKVEFVLPAIQELTAGSYVLVNGSIGVTINDRLSISVFGRNLFNEVYFAQGYSNTSFTGLNYRSPGVPRTYGLRVGFNF
jgi:iron complex outermembrane recepter protein